MEREIALKQLEFLKTKIKPMRLAAEEWDSDWKRLISIILSARTRDETTIYVCEEMFEKFPTLEEFSKLKPANISRLISSINFYENKSKYIYQTIQKLVKNFGGEVPHNFEDLLTLPGVGRKTANVFLAEEGGANIGVDTHVEYISKYLSWTENKDPEKIEYDLMNLFPENKWNEINKTLVGFGKTYTSFNEKNKILDEVKKIS